MKKISLLAFVFVTSTALYAQNDVETKTATTKFGMKAGVNLAKLRPSDVPSGVDISTNLKTSFGGGFFANIPLGTGCMAFQPEILFNGQGSKITVKQTALGITTETTYEQDLRYLSMPLMLQFRSNNGFYGEVGPQLSFLLDARYDGPGDSNWEDEESFESFEFSAGAGLGYVSKMGLGIGARYNHGFSNVLDNEATSGSSENTRMRHSVIHVGLFYQFGK